MIADDHNIIRYGLEQALSHEKNMQVIAQADSGEDAVAMAREHKPDVILMDISMPNMNGMEATKQICRHAPDTKVIALSMHTEKKIILSMLQAGAQGYLLKTNFFKDLLKAIQTVMAGEIFLSPEITRYVVTSAVNTHLKKKCEAFCLLTSRERQVLQLIAEGKTSAYIADHLFISKKTVSAHRHNIMSKLNLDNIPDLTRFAIKQGITSLEY